MDKNKLIRQWNSIAEGTKENITRDDTYVAEEWKGVEFPPEAVVEEPVNCTDCYCLGCKEVSACGVCKTCKGSYNPQTECIKGKA